MQKLKEIFRITSIPVFIASICCLAPIVLVAAGISTIAFGISLTNLLDGQYRWAFQVAGVATLALSLTLYFRNKGICTLDQVKKHQNEIINKSILYIISALIFYYLFFNIFLTWIGQILKLWN